MNPRSDTFIISRYGWDILVPFSLLTFILLVFIGFELFTFLLLLSCAFLLFVHRNPERISNYAQAGSILCSVDGYVKEIISIDNSPIDGKPGFEIIIQSRLKDTAVLRAPMTSTMSIDKFLHGAMLSTNSALKELNETADIRFSSSVGDVLVRHTLGSWTRPLRFGVEGEIMQNQRYGFMLNGTTSIFLPSNSRVAVKEGMSLSAGESVIGFFSETA